MTDSVTNPPFTNAPASNAPATNPPATNPAPSARIGLSSPAVGALELPPGIWSAMVAHCLAAYPDEGCGLLGGDAGRGVARSCYPTANAAASARIYTVAPGDHLRADRQAEARGESIIGVFHSHTHTDAYPSPTDVDQAPDPSWHYVLVSLRDTHPVVRSYRIVAGSVAEEPVVVVEHAPSS